MTLTDGRTDLTYAPPLTVIAYRGGMLLVGGTTGAGFNATGNLGDGTAAADTDAAPPNGMPWDENAKLASFVSNIGVTDGVSRDAPMLPTPTLTALASPGRNPADIAISIWTGGEGSGGEGGDALVGGGSSSASSADGVTLRPEDDPPGGAQGTNLVAAQGSAVGILGAKQLLDDHIRQLGGVVPDEARAVEQVQMLGTAFDGVNEVTVPYPQTMYVDGRGPLAGQKILVTPPVPEEVVRGFNMLCAGAGLIGNGFEATGAIGLAGAPEPFVTKAGAVGLGLLAIDGGQANIRTLCSLGEPTPTVLNQLVTNATGSPVLGSAVDFGAHAGGSVYGATQVPKLATSFRLGSAAEVAPSSGTVRGMDPNALRFSQRSAGGSGRATPLRESMAGGWNGPAVDAVETADGIVTIDNTRVAIARELGMEEIPINLHLPSDPLPESMLGRFGDAKTWGEALAQRTGKQQPPLPFSGTPDTPRLPQ